MKAQSFFGGTKPNETGVGVRQVGSTGKVQSKTGYIKPKVTVKQTASHPVPTTITRKTTVKQVGSTGRLK